MFSSKNKISYTLDSYLVWLHVCISKLALMGQSMNTMTILILPHVLTSECHCRMPNEQVNNHFKFYGIILHYLQYVCKWEILYVLIVGVFLHKIHSQPRSPCRLNPPLHRTLVILRGCITKIWTLKVLLEGEFAWPVAMLSSASGNMLRSSHCLLRVC